MRRHGIVLLLVCALCAFTGAGAAMLGVRARAGAFLRVLPLTEPICAILLDERWTKNLTEQSDRTLLWQQLEETIGLAREEGANYLLWQVDDRTENVLFQDESGQTTPIAALAKTGLFGTSSDVIRELVTRARTGGISIGMLYHGGETLPNWLLLQAQRYGMTVWSEEWGADEEGFFYYSNPQGERLLCDLSINDPASLALAVQTGQGQRAMVLGCWADLTAGNTTRLALYRAFTEGELPSLLSYLGEKGIPRILTVQNPEQSGSTVYSPSLFLMGTSNPDQPLTLDGEEIARGERGTWGTLRILSEGKNLFHLQNGTEELAYTVYYEAPVTAKPMTPIADKSRPAEAGEKLRITGALASALFSPSVPSTVEDLAETFYQGGTAEVVESVRYQSGNTLSYAYRLASGHFVRASECELVTQPDADFSQIEVGYDPTVNCTTLRFVGTGTPLLYQTREGDALSISFLSARYTGPLPVANDFILAWNYTEQPERKGFTLELATAPDALYGYTVDYDIEDGTTTVFLKHTPYLTEGKKPLAERTILLDAGHGGDDWGAQGTAGERGVGEKELNLAVAQAVRVRLEQLGARVQMTRNEDVFYTLGERVTTLNEQKPDLFIALHHNSLPLTKDCNKVSGTEAYWYTPGGEALATALTRKIAAATGRQVRQTRRAYFYVTRSNICPAVLLELGYLVCPQEYEACAEEKIIWAEAGAIAEGIAELLGTND